MTSNPELFPSPYRRAPDIAAALGVWRPIPATPAWEFVVFVHALWREPRGRVIMAIRTISPEDATTLLDELLAGDFTFLNQLRTPVAIIRYQDKPEELP